MAERTLATSLVLLTVFGVASCSSGGGGGNPGTTSFQVTSLTLQDGAIWEINREIVLTFTEPVDFSTVSSNTINLRSLADVPAVGVFRLRDPFTVVFQPNCPTFDDFSDAGLQPGGVTYVLRVPGKNTSPNTVRSLAGVPLGLQQTRTFTTPASSQPSIVFQDTKLGAPRPIVRDQGSTLASSTYLEIGGDPDERVYFERDANDAIVLSVPGFEAPLNLYSDLATRIAVLVSFDQPVSPSEHNISDDRLRLEFRDPQGHWHATNTRATLVANCTETGSTVRLEPIGPLPPASAVRAVILPGFQDLVGEAVLSTDVGFSLAPTRPVDFTSLIPADEISDEFNESYEFGGDSPLSYQDTSALFDAPVADWGDGRLSAAFSFEGTGGPGGTFDWVVHTGEVFFFDTTSTSINGGPDGVPTTTQNAVNGVLDVRNFTIERGGEVRVQGPNPMRVNATGFVQIDGKLDLSGFNSKDVATLNTGNQVEIGAVGAAGGGKGGNANDNINGPTPRGGRGQGPFRSGNLGGVGGEMGFSTNASKNARRPGGGGGGRFTKDWVGTNTIQNQVSLAAAAGSNGNPSSTGAETGLRPSRGGSAGEGPFLDTRNDNDFFGVRPIVVAGELTGLIRGELPSLWAGYGGGGGGNAGTRFPNPAWNANADEKGGGGGGGAGGLHIKALGRIVFGRAGQIVANGGRGATGENTNFLDHIGGTGGGGSGGHVILESAAVVDFTDGGVNLDSPLRDFILAAGPVKKEGPIEDVDTCGESSLCCSPLCRTMSNGGAGGGGLVQIHVPDPRKPPGTQPPADILVPEAAMGAANVLDEVTSPPAYVMIPTFGKRSKARSDWISIGGADQNPDGSAGLVRFLFDGIDSVTGRVLTVGSTVQSRTPLFAEADLSTSSTAEVQPGGFTLELVGAALDAIRAGTTSGISNDIYLRTPSLLEECAIRLRVEETPVLFEDFSIASAVYDEGGPALGDEALRVTIGGARPLTAFNPGNIDGTTGLLLLPRFFQVVTNGVADSLPQTAFVSLRFQAASDNGIGAPDESNPLQDWTSDISLFNTKPAGALQFFRYEVEFDLDKDNTGITADTEPVTLDFLKIPFVF
jgi:hypothetical protein